MTAARYDLVIDQGSDFAIEFTVAESGSAKNLSGYTARAASSVKEFLDFIGYVYVRHSSTCEWKDKYDIAKRNIFWLNCRKIFL